MGFITCPSCWNRIEVLPWTVEVVCPYCNTAILIQRDKIETIWKQTAIVPFPTTFEIWKYFYAVEDKNSNDVIWDYKVRWLSEEDKYKFKIEKFIVKVYISGHIRCMNDSGFWDKWFGFVIDDKLSLFENKNVMIQEDEGLIAVFNITDEKIDNTKFEKLFENVGNVVDWYFVNEAGVCNIEWIEWQFSYPILWKQIKYVDILRWKEYNLVENTWWNILFFKKI